MGQAAMRVAALGCGPQPTLRGERRIVQPTIVRSRPDSSLATFSRFGDHGATLIVRQASQAEGRGLGRWGSTVSFTRKIQRFPEQHGLISFRRRAELVRSLSDPTPTYFRDAPVCPTPC